jgi:hypothetical protein
VIRQLLEAPHIDLDEAVRLQHHDVAAQLQQPVARLIARERPSGDVQGLVEVVDRGPLSAVGPQRSQENIPVQPLITRERQELDERPRLAEPPGSGLDGLTVALDDEPTEQSDLHDHLPIERSRAAR